MAEYIERERARHECKYFFKGDEKAQEDCESLLCDLPAADVAPVRRGHWIKRGYACGKAEFECSHCHETEWRANETDYCPNCGAKMEV